MKQEQSLWGQDHPPLVVATVHTPGGLRQAPKLTRRAIDRIEIRLDHFPSGLLPEALQKIRPPLILTPRHQSEGGICDWSDAERTSCALPLLPLAWAVDVELSRIRQLAQLRTACMEQGIPLIFSFHDFSATPKISRLLKLRDRAFAGGASIFKVATQIRDLSDLAILMDFLNKSNDLPVAIMGMGPLGRASRLLFSVAGSVLTYGWLHQPQVSGQFPALILKDRIRELTSA